MIVFTIGAMAAGISGVIYAPLAAVIPNMGEPFLVQCFVVVVIGGLGSFPGAVVGGIVVGEILSLTTLFDPAYSQAAIYAVMALVLIVRPRGLFGTMGRV
jgi:branched-chain amino acid transport system permease protein